MRELGAQVATTARGRAAQRSSSSGDDGVASFDKVDGKVVKTVNGMRYVRVGGGWIPLAELEQVRFCRYRFCATVFAS
jgi:hypothetical protein